MTFWYWFTTGSGGPRGLTRIVNRWLILHAVIGTVIACLVPSSISQTANTVLVPLIGVFVGVSFAWGANAQAMLQTDQIRRMTEQRRGGFAEYVFAFQIATLVILATLGAWGLGGLGVFDSEWTNGRPLLYGSIENSLYTLASVTMRECWHVVVGTQLMLLQWADIKREEETNQGSPPGA